MAWVRKRGLSLIEAAGLVFGLALGLGGCATGQDGSTTAASPWSLSAANPILSGSQIAGTAWNDPCVVKDGATWVMYLSRNIETGARTEGAVATFRATSADGLSWNLGSSPVLEPGSSLDFDYNVAETPCVVSFGGLWHLYYSGISQVEASPTYRIGHATSSDGITWTKDPGNPILGKEDLPSPASVLHVGEPGALVVGGVLYLYFTVTSSSDLAIYRSESADGSSFSAPQKVLSKTATWSDSSYLGYSTPCAVYDGTEVHLFYDLYKRDSVDNGGTEHQVALLHASSTDGLYFTEDASAFIMREDADWTSREVRAPWVLIDGDSWRLWYAGDNYVLTSTSWTGSMGIGYGTAPASAF